MSPVVARFGEEDVFLLPGGSALVPRLVVPGDSWWRWHRLLDLLVSGECVPLCEVTARYLVESRPVRSHSRAGFVLAINSCLVRVWLASDGWFGEVLPSPCASVPVCHDVVCVRAVDAWDVLVCVCCGRAW